MKKYKTDWLASKPVFYNEKTLKISHNINDVIDYSDINFHPEGLNNYLDFGYSVFQQTPLKNVKFLRHSSEIWVENNKLKIIEKPDPVIKWFEDNLGYKDEGEVLELIKKKVRDWEKSTEGDIVIPLSGGYDSRLLAYFIKDRSRLKAFTYGISNRQEDSYEVVNAKEICKRLGISWRQIFLGDQHKYFDEWDQHFGISTHAHGMYHFEFYTKMNEYLKGAEYFLSGIIGDAWAGSIVTKKINSPKDLALLGYTHGMTADSKHSKYPSSSMNEMSGFFIKNKDYLKDERYRLVTSMRLKLILLSYLFTVPEVFSFKPWSPYLDMEVALSMLSIDPGRRKNRSWQKEFFEKINLDVDISTFSVNKTNNLNHQAMQKIKLKPLNVELLCEVIEEDYVNWINKILLDTPLLYKIIPKIKSSNINPWLIKKGTEGLNRIGLKDKVMEAYCAYLTLKPIENVLYRRNKYLKENKS